MYNDHVVINHVVINNVVINHVVINPKGSKVLKCRVVSALYMFPVERQPLNIYVEGS